MASSTTSSVRRDVAELFGSFHLGGTELALPVADVQEVVNFPAAVTQVPLAPAYLLGLFNLRGRLIPMVHLGQLLGLPDNDARENAKVAIVDFRGSRVGLLFDATGEILRVRSEEKVTFDGESSMIGGALKLDGGNRILQVLNVDALHGLHGMPIPRADLAADPLRQRALLAKRRQCVSFRVNDTRLALPMGAIHEIIRVPELAHSVLASELCLGRFNLRGNIVTVVDFTRFLALPVNADDASPVQGFDDTRRVVVIRQQEIFFGMLVHEVESIVGYRDDELLAMPSFDASRPHLFTGCVVRAGMPDIILIDSAALLSDDIVAELTQGHHALYQADAAAEHDQGISRNRARETYVTFHLGRLMGMRIDQLREVIEFPSDVMHPPGAPSFVRGIFKLRQELITIVDLRALYGLDDYAHLTDAKLLVVENDGEKFGLVVDGIENIVTIDVADKIGVPSILRQQIDQPFRSDMREVVEMPDQRTLMLLDAMPLKGRLSAQMVH